MPPREFVLTDEFRDAMELLAGGRHLFLTGKAGTGKSTLIRRFMSQTDRTVVVAAPTGIAALNVGGYTIHRLFGFTPTTSLADIRTGGYYPGRFARTVKGLDTLIIDEASMVRADLFDKMAAALQRYGPDPGAPFGGVQLVLVGDLYQLPPVVTEAETDFFTDRYATPYFFSADTFDRDEFPMVSLTTVFRQLGDDRMTAILNEIREGVLLGHALAELNTRTDPEFVPPADEFWLTLAPTNRLVSARNRRQLELLPGDEITHHARHTGDLSLFDPPADETLRFKVGAQIMMLTNDPADRWVNGTLGRIIARVSDGTGVVVEFTDGSRAEVTPFTWEATRPVVDGGSLQHEVCGTFTQLPFALAWAITIHKSQGQTLDRLVVDLTGGMFSYGQLYVALSRCTSMNGLVLKRPVLPKDLKTDRRIARFLRSAEPDDGNARRHCGIGIVTVGEEGRMSRPRPVELAVAFDDGTAVSTLINPQRDLANARSAYDISVADILLAPTLAEAWGVIAPMLSGCTPVGPGIDETLGLIDFELKRLGQTVVMPLGVEVPRARTTGGTALQRATDALTTFTESGSTTTGSTPFGDPPESLTGHLLTRDPAATPISARLPALSALLDVSRYIGPALLGLPSGATPPPDTPWTHAARHSVAAQLRAAAGRIQPTEQVWERLHDAEELLGVEILDPALRSTASAPDIETVLEPGARVCFTGTALDDAGRELSREEMMRIAERAGLTPVKTVTKTRCEVVVTAEPGSQSGKARKAHELGKPVFTAQDFLRWARHRSSSSRTP